MTYVSAPLAPLPRLEFELPLSDEASESHPKALATQASPTSALDDAKRLDSSKFPNPPRKAGHGPLATIPNVAHLLRSYGITVRYNIIKKKLVITMPGHVGSPDNFDSSALTQIISFATLNGMPTGQIAAIVETLGDRNLLNPVADWIQSKPWDGIDRLPDLYGTLVESETFPKRLKEALMRRWFLSLVAAALKPSGFRCRGVLTLQGQQGIGKTAWAKSLVSDPALAEDVIKLDHHMDAGNKDSLLGAITNWVVEIGELESSFKRDIARLKGFLTDDRDKVRRPYGRVESEYARKTVFCATVNDYHFLVDTTGNTRWWTLPLTSINYQHGIDMQQAFAQLAVVYEGGEQWWLTAAEERELEEQNKAHRTVSALRERMLDKLDLKRVGRSNLPAKTCIEVLRDIGIDHPSNPQCKEGTQILREIFGLPKRINGKDKWRVPYLDTIEYCMDDPYGDPIATTNSSSNSMNDTALDEDDNF